MEDCPLKSKWFNKLYLEMLLMAAYENKRNGNLILAGFTC